LLRPTDTATRERKSLTGIWRFGLDAAGEGRSARWFAGPLRDARAMAVPASYNDVPADAAGADSGSSAHRDPDAAGFYRQLLPRFAKTGTAVEALPAWAPDQGGQIGEDHEARR
jgi:hypothetical protein